MNRKMTFVLFFAFLLIGCGGGEAPEGQQFWQIIVEHVLEIVVVIATPLVLLLVQKLIKVIEDKAGITVAQVHEQMIDEWVTKGIAYGHEQGRKALKAGKDPVTGDEKKNAAVDFIAAGLDNTGLVTMGRDALAKLVESKLNIERLPEDTEEPAESETDEEE